MYGQFSRTELLIGKEAMDKLKKSTVAVFGIGGVGTFAVEGLVRSGIGKIVLVDSDVIELSNINRQLIATMSTVGRPKVEVMRERIADINPAAGVVAHQCFFTEENSSRFDFKEYDYIVDAIDTVSSKIALVIKAKTYGRPVISCMGAGNKLDPARFEVADIYSTSVCPLAKVMRKELKQRGVDSLKVVYSKEMPLKPVHGGGKDGAAVSLPEKHGSRRQIPGSISFVPSVAGLIIAGEVIKDLIFQEPL